MESVDSQQKMVIVKFRSHFQMQLKAKKEDFMRILEKRVDYSSRSVIVVGPLLCGLAIGITRYSYTMQYIYLPKSHPNPSNCSFKDTRQMLVSMEDCINTSA
ncbi:Uncharacterized protein Fot_19236 [Forsythia ovata]|uniref:Uncharacterized protein n=1 Tax=Forsythia ovata TaxID=205694 RepID=A0ABD1VNA3_9LAMI